MNYTNTVTVEKHGFPEDLVEGGYTRRHNVVSCNVDPAIGTLEYFRRSFPGGSGSGLELIPDLPAQFRRHVSEMWCLTEEEIAELRETHNITVSFQ